MPCSLFCEITKCFWMLIDKRIAFLVSVTDIGDDAIEDVCFPSGIPFIYKFDQCMKPLAPTKGSLTQLHTSGEFLEKPGLLNNALNAQKEYFESGFVTKDVKLKASMSNLEESLLKLENEKEMEKWQNSL